MVIARPTDVLLIARLRRLGIVVPVRMITAARDAGLSIPLAASMLIEESSGGHNEFGHDRTIYVGAGAVTEHKYIAYRAERDRTGEAQGVGPCQLTFPGYQDAADKLGGCWLVLPNLREGFMVLAENVRRAGLKAGVAAYNGTGPPAELYAVSVIGRADRFAAALHLPAP